MAETVPLPPESPVPGKVTIGIPKETAPGETRVSLNAETVSRFTSAGIDVVVQAGAGVGASIADAEYTASGAMVVADATALYDRANLVLKVQAPSDQEVAALRPGTTLISFLAPLVNHKLVRELAGQGVTALAMDAVPRITRAQSMDALSAMATISGYKAVLLAATDLPKFFPLLMTAAGTIRPAKVLVIGAGVAGLQAIATARRLGAVVEAYDTRPVVKEQVESLGARFVEIDTGSKDTQDAGGYARQATAEELRLQQEGLNSHIADSDVVVTTALVPGRPAPRLIPASAVEAMRTGSVIVDLAAETGGNCGLTTPGEVAVQEGVTIIGTLNLPATMPVHASQMYARVIQNLLELLLKDGRIDLNLDDEIIRGMCITHGGEVIQEATRKAMNLNAAPPAPAQEAPTTDVEARESDLPAPELAAESALDGVPTIDREGVDEASGVAPASADERERAG